MSASTTATAAASSSVTLHVGIPTFVPFTWMLNGAPGTAPADAASGTMTLADPAFGSATVGTMTAEFATAKVPAGTLGGLFTAQKSGSTTATYTDDSMTATLPLLSPTADTVGWDTADAVQEPASSTGTTSTATAPAAS